MLDERIKAIRLDPVVGRGSCSSIDECMSDEDLYRSLNRDSVSTPKDAVTWARDHERLFLERGLDQRWGEDSDWQLKAYKDFKKMCEHYPVNEGWKLTERSNEFERGES